MTRAERNEFRLFCGRATDVQLREIIVRERLGAAGGNRSRRACYGIATAEQARRIRGIIRDVLANHTRDK